MMIDNKFNIGDHVYVITDIEQEKGIITSILVSQNGLLYNVSRNSLTHGFYDFELSEEKDKLIGL